MKQRQACPVCMHTSKDGPEGDIGNYAIEEPDRLVAPWPCGHLWHRFCAVKWVQTGRRECWCRRGYTKKELLTPEGVAIKDEVLPPSSSSGAAGGEGSAARRLVYRISKVHSTNADPNAVSMNNNDGRGNARYRRDRAGNVLAQPGSPAWTPAEYMAYSS